MVAGRNVLYFIVDWGATYKRVKRVLFPSSLGFRSIISIK